MDNITLGKYINNNSILTRIDSRFKIGIMAVLLVFCFLDLNIFGFLSLFLLLSLLMVIGKLSFKSLINVVKHMWLLFVVLFVVNLFVVKGEVLFKLWDGAYIYKDSIIQTAYIILRIIMILMVSTLLSSSTTPSEITYGLEFYLKPLKIFHINVYEVAIMISIALRFIPTLIDELNRIKKAQTSRGLDFEYGKYIDKIRGLTSLFIPLLISCFDKSDELTDAMISRGYDSEMPRSRYNRLSVGRVDIVASICIGVSLILILVINGVLL